MNAGMARVRVQFFLDEEKKKIIDQLAGAETRTAPNVVERLVDEALAARGLINLPEVEAIKEQEKSTP